MYKRKFNAPARNEVAGTVGPAAVAAGLTVDNADMEVKKQQLIRKIFGSDDACDKENHPQLGVMSTAKRQKFILPTHTQTHALRPVQQQHLTSPFEKAGVKGVPAYGCTTAVAGVASARVFSVLYTKREKWKKKSDKGFQDGIIELRADSCTLLDMEGKAVTKGKPKLPKELDSGTTFDLGNFVCEYDQDIDYDSYKRGTCFTEACHAAPASNPTLALALPKSTAGSNHTHRAKSSASRAGLPGRLAGRSAGPAVAGGGAAAAGGAGGAAGLFDPAAPGALLVNSMQWQEGQGRLENGRAVAPVVVDPYIARHLRPHQREGVKFMYECVMGLKNQHRQGCLLADEMGLGKTLQVIALLWTLLRQGPEGVPVARKAIVVAPATLVTNWGKEVKKWLGQERMGFIQLSTGPEAAAKVKDFKLGSVWKLLIGSYETLRKYAGELEGCCDVLVCDEGHRLKATGGNKTINALLGLGCQRRIVLTGTPLQNNLQELHALLSFAAGDVLGSATQFKRIYGDPITRSRDKDATAKEKELGAARAEELQRQTAAFVLRRTQEVLSKHLPPLAVHTVFCKPSQLQHDLYSKFLHSKRMTSLLFGQGGGDLEGVLPAITVLRKICNHPKLLLSEATSGKTVCSADHDSQQQCQGQMKLGDVAAQLLQQQLQGGDKQVEAVELSGKLLTLSAILTSAISQGNKVVVVSTSTTALDLVDNLLCGPQRWQSVRIDGGTSVDDRQTIVDNFNLRGVGQVFLLSTRAGGAGLNLIGANHLVLYDSDWNPAMDKQAMARIWRDGQAKPCFVYRLLTTGTIEEKVYQRQIMKADLADATMEAGGKIASMSHNELKQLFALEVGSECSTKQLLDSCNAGESVRWLPLPGTAGSSGSSSSLPTTLAAAVAAGAVTAINKEKSAGESTDEAGTLTTSRVRDASLSTEKQPQDSSSLALATVDDVLELELDDL